MRKFQPINIDEDQNVSIIQRGNLKGMRREWDKRSNEKVANFKGKLREALFIAQNGACGYCLLPIGNEEAHRVPQIDHFVPWKKYTEWTFEPMNLILACATCNEDRKADADTLADSSRYRPLRPYSTQDFLYVHPYLDDVSDHITGGYATPDSRPRAIRSKTEKGASTIRLFRLNTGDMLRLWEDEFLRIQRTKMSREARERFDSIMDEISS